MQRPIALRIASAPVISALLALLLAACGAPGELGVPGELGEPRLLASAYEATRSRLVLIDPERPNGAWEELAAIEHAEGWDIEGVVAPSGDAAALLALPPGRSQPRAEAVLWLVTATERRVLAEGLDLYAGLAFSQGGERLAVARSAAGQVNGRLTGRLNGRLELLDVRSGAVVARYEAAGAPAIYPLALRGDRVWAAALEASGWALWRLAVDAPDGQGGPDGPGEIVREARWALGRESQRRWTLSPDADELALEVRSGAAFRVVIHSLDGSAGTPRRIAAAAAPAWHPGGELSVGRWEGGGGFTLPIAWDAAGRWLAVNAYDGVGPGAPGRARLAVERSDGEFARIERAGLFAIGWWSG